MDGTLAVWQPAKQLEDLYQPGYFAGLKSQPTVVELVRSGIANGLVRLITDPNLESGTVCSIGGHWFYFGGLTAEEMSPGEYRKNIPIEDISREIAETLEDFAKDESFAEEYSYYLSILKGGFDNGGNSTKPML